MCDIDDGCGGTCMCPSGTGCVQHQCQATARSYPSPGPAPRAWGDRFPAPFSVTLASDDYAAVIYYTTDGATPTTSSPHGPSPLTGINITNATTLKFFAVNSVGAEPVETVSYGGIDPGLQQGAAYIVFDSTFSGKGTTVVVPAGKTISAQTHYQFWVQQAFSFYRAQLVYGVDQQDQGCLEDEGPGAFPGVTRTINYSLTAPSTPGVYDIKVAHTEQSSCSQAMSQNSIATRPTATKIGTLIVN
jgi:hypothetical protein